MEMKRCEQGHFYDAQKTPGCPYCSGDFGEGRTRPLNAAGGDSIGSTRPLDGGVMKNNDRLGEGVTVAIMVKEKGIDPVVGWLVCIEGGDKGRDYRIHAERNFIGRGENMDICIHNDDTISRESHAILSFDPRKNVFRIYPGESKGIVYLNDEEVTSATGLKDYDLIELGTTKLMFISFCGERFKW